jgi:cofilin
MATNADVPDEVMVQYNQLQREHKFHYLIFKIENKKTIVLDSSLSTEEKFEYPQFHKKVTSIKDPRFIIIDYHTTTPDNRQIDKVVFISWIPDTAPVGQKMVYASAAENFKKKLPGIAKSHQATDEREMEESSLQATIFK